MSQVNNVSSIASGIDLGPAGSLQFQFAKLQLALSEVAKNNAMDYIDQIQKSQDEQKKVSQMLQEARQAQANAKSQGDKAKTEMSSQLKVYVDANGLAYDKGTITKNTETLAANEKKIKEMEAQLAKAPTTLDRYAIQQNIINLKAENVKLQTAIDKPSFTNAEWDVAINSLKAQLDQLGTDTQQKMVFVQDFMGQYNSYLQGANSAIQQSNQTLAELARVR